jgi:hypothetical protein
MIIIGIAGKAQSGKSTSGKIIKSLLEKNKKVVSIRPLAAKLKQICEDLFGWDGDKGLHYDDNGILIQDKGRQLLINVGTDKMRQVRPTVWVDYVLKHLDDFSYFEKKPDVVIIDDVRFRNEVEKIKGAGVDKVVLIKIERELQENIDSISEKDLDGYSGFDLTLPNDETLEDLEADLFAYLVSNGIIE